MLVSTVAFLMAGDEIYEMFTGISPNHVGNKLVVFAGTFVVVGLLHLPVVILIVRRAPRAVGCLPTIGCESGL